MSDTPTVTLTGRGRWPVFAVLTLVALTIVYPLFFILVTSSRSNPDYLSNPFGMPAQWTFDNYQELLDVYGVGQAFLNSLFVSTVSVVLVLTLATIAGYALAKLPVPGQKWISAAFISVMLVPGPVLIIPIYLLLSKFGLLTSVLSSIRVAPLSIPNPVRSKGGPTWLRRQIGRCRPTGLNQTKS